MSVSVRLIPQNEHTYPKMLFTEIIGFVHCIVACTVCRTFYSCYTCQWLLSMEKLALFRNTDRERRRRWGRGESEWQPNSYGRRINNRLIMDFRIL